MNCKASLLRLISFVIIGVSVVCFAEVESASADPLGDLYERFDSLSIGFDRERANEAAVAAALLSIDPHASLLIADTNAPALEDGADLVVEYWSQGIGYLDLNSLSLSVASNVVLQVAEWDASAGLGVILDLRGVGGWEYRAVPLVAGLIIKRDVPLFTLSSLVDGAVAEIYNTEGPGDCCIPLVILMDGDTHGASEVIAAVLKGRGGAMLVGASSRGDGVIRRPVALTETLSIVIASSHISLMDGYEYAGVGVLPDIVIDSNQSGPPKIDVSSTTGVLGRPLSDKALNDRDLMKRTEDDAVLRRATDILLGFEALGEFDGPHAEVNEETLPENK